MSRYGVENSVKGIAVAERVVAEVQVELLDSSKQGLRSFDRIPQDHKSAHDQCFPLRVLSILLAQEDMAVAVIELDQPLVLLFAW